MVCICSALHNTGTVDSGAARQSIKGDCLQILSPVLKTAQLSVDWTHHSGVSVWLSLKQREQLSVLAGVAWPHQRLSFVPVYCMGFSSLD